MIADIFIVPLFCLLRTNVPRFIKLSLNIRKPRFQLANFHLKNYFFVNISFDCGEITKLDKTNLIKIIL